MDTLAGGLAQVGVVAWLAGRQMAWLVVTLSSAVVFFDAGAGGKPDADLFPTIWSLVTTVASFLVVAHLIAALRDAFDRVRRMALTDELTGVGNRRGFIQFLQVIKDVVCRGQVFDEFVLDADGGTQLWR